MNKTRMDRESHSSDPSPQRQRKLRHTRSSLLEILHLRPNTTLSRSKSGTIKGIVGNDDVRQANVCHARSPSEGDKDILKALRSDWGGECYRRASLRKTAKSDSSPAGVGLMQRIFSLRHHRKSVPNRPVGGASADAESRRSRLAQMEEHAAWCNNNNNTASPQVKVRHYRSMSLSPSISSTPPLAMFSTDEDICSSVPPSPKEGDTTEDGTLSSPANRRQISPEMETEIEKLLKEKTKLSRVQLDSEKADHPTGPTVKCFPSKNKKTCMYISGSIRTELDKTAGRNAVSNPGTLRKFPEVVDSHHRSSSLQSLVRNRQVHPSSKEPQTDSDGSGQRVIVQTVQLSEIITWKQVATENKKGDSQSDRTQHQTDDGSSHHHQDGSENTDGNEGVHQTNTQSVDCHEQEEHSGFETDCKPSQSLDANVNKSAGSSELKTSVTQGDSSVRRVGPLHMVIQPRRRRTPSTGTRLTDGSVMANDAITNTSRMYKEKLTLMSQDGQQKSYSSVISDGDSPVEVTVTSQQVTWVHAQCMCTDMQDNRFSLTSNDSGIQQDEVPSSSETTKGELLWPDEVTTSHVMLEPSHDRVPPKKERPKSCLSVPGLSAATLPALHRGCRSHPKERSTSDLGGRAVVLEALQQYHLTDRVSSTTTLVETDIMGPVSAVERCRMKGRRMSTPHPIKLRECRSPPLRKRTSYNVVQTLPRRSSAPELIDRKVQFRWRSSCCQESSAQAGDLAFRIRKCLSDGEKALPTLDDSSCDEITPAISSVRRSSGDILQGIFARSSSQPTYADALWDHVTLDVEELGFTAGDVIEVLDTTGRDWWYGTMGDREGWFPATFVRICNNWDNTADEFAQRVKEGSIDSDTALRSYSANLLSKDQARANVVLEIIHAERDYVKHLHDVLEGYVEKACRRPEMFSEDTLNTIFGNIVELHDFSSTFLQDLESHIVDGVPHLSQLGDCFLQHRQGFELYSEYCNNHPLACEQLRLLKQNKKYQQFFEACRLLQQMIEIPLEGFLLIPVQKICKYPLQLKELLRFTRPHHPDYYCLQRALVCMRRIAALINERKRKMESLQKLAEWQNAVNDWQGTDLIETSSELIHSGELMKVNSSGWSQDRVFFLFDHQMIYCKKDMLWRDLLIYKGRIDMDNCEACPITDGKDAMFNAQVKNAFKVFDLSRHKWYLLQCHSDIEKQQWLDALQLERQRVRSDVENGFNLPEFRSKVAFLHHRQQVCAAGGKLGKGDKRKSMEASTSFCSQDMPLNLLGHSSLPRCVSTPGQAKKTGFHPFGRRKGKR